MRTNLKTHLGMWAIVSALASVPIVSTYAHGERSQAAGGMMQDGHDGMMGGGMMGMMGMMQQMSNMMESCNKMMKSMSNHQEADTPGSGEQPEQ